MAASEAAATAGVLVVALMMTAVLATSSLVISLYTVINGFCSKQIYNATRKKPYSVKKRKSFELLNLKDASLSYDNTSGIF